MKWAMIFCFSCANCVVHTRTHIIRRHTATAKPFANVFSLCARCTRDFERQWLCRWYRSVAAVAATAKHLHQLLNAVRWSGLAFASILLMLCRSKIITMSIFKSVVTKQRVCAHRLIHITFLCQSLIVETGKFNAVRSLFKWNLWNFGFYLLAFCHSIELCLFASLCLWILFSFLFSSKFEHILVSKKSCEYLL